MKKKIITTILLTLILIALSSTITYAYSVPYEYKPANQPFGTNQYIDDGSKATVVILQTIAGGLLYFAAPIAIIMIVQAGFNIVVGGADSEKLEQSKKHVTWAIIGLALIILSYTAVRTIIGIAFKAGSMAS